MDLYSFVSDGICLLRDLRPAVEIDGTWIQPEQLRQTAPGVFFTTLDNGVEMTLTRKDHATHSWLQLAVKNNSNRQFKLGGFRFRQTGGQNDFLATPGERLRLFKEGWTMASACASVRYGETDFNLNPEYVPFAASTPSAYDSTTPNFFSAEYVTVLNDKETGRSLLTGFISSADQITRVAVTLGQGGVTDFAVYSYADGILFDPKETVVSEELVIMTGPDGYSLLQTFAELWGKRMNALSGKEIPTGWCSWYYYFEKITEADVLENVGYIAAHRDEYPLKYLQLDDGYQPALGDWLAYNEKFPRGLKFLAGEITAAGMTPGLWLAPFLVEEKSQLFAEHPDWMVKDASGLPVRVFNWRGDSPTAVLDGTHPEVQAHFIRLFRELVQMGFEYVKLDFMVYACAVKDGVYYDRKATRAQALYRGLQAIRTAMEDRFILGCTVPLGPAIGLVNGERISTDITPYWQGDGPYFKEAPTVPNVCRNLINRCYMNHRLWINDPDVLIARIDNNKLTESEVLLWTNALYLVGGMILLTDRFTTLDPKRAELCKRLLREPDAFVTSPLDFFEREFPAVWLARHRRTGAIVVGIFNFTDETATIEVDLTRIEPAGCFEVYDHFTRKPLGKFTGVYAETLPSHASRLIEIKPV